MDRKLVLALAVAGVFAAPMSVNAQSDERQEAPKPELITQSDERQEAPKPELSQRTA